MTHTKGDAALLEKLFSELGYAHLTVAGGARSMMVSFADDTGASRERIRLVVMPKKTYRAEFAEQGRWRSGQISGSLDAVVRTLVKSGVLGQPEAAVANERLERLRAYRRPAETATPKPRA